MLEPHIDINFRAQTTLPVGAGGLSHMQRLEGAAPRWIIFQPALIPQLIPPEVRNHAVPVVARLT
jgi:hypothetical protein